MGETAEIVLILALIASTFAVWSIAIDCKRIADAIEAKP